MTEWTREDSAAIDQAIRDTYPKRRPLRYDPDIAALIHDTEPGGIPADVDTCIDCKRPIWRNRQPRPPGYLFHAGNGRCPTCRHRHRTPGMKPRKLRILNNGDRTHDQQATG